MTVISNFGISLKKSFFSSKIFILVFSLEFKKNKYFFFKRGVSEKILDLDLDFLGLLILQKKNH